MVLIHVTFYHEISLQASHSFVSVYDRDKAALNNSTLIKLLIKNDIKKILCLGHFTVELQWVEHRLFVYHGCFELVLVSLGKNPIGADSIIFGII